MLAHTDNSIIMPPGIYRLGDPCYSVPHHRWMEWLTAADYDATPNPTNLFAEIDGRMVIGFGTAYGDGCYPGSNGFDYGVDAGLIGLVPIEVAGDYYKDRTDLWTLLVLEKPTLCTNSDKTPGTGGSFAGRTHGLMTFGDITINTLDEEDDDEDEQEQEKTRPYCEGEGEVTTPDGNGGEETRTCDNCHGDGYLS